MPTDDDAADRIAQLQERADHAAPESWIPEAAGEEIAGELVRYESGHTAYGRQVIAVVKPPNADERSLWLLHSVLRAEFAKQRPRPGELVLIRYLGRKQGADGTGYAAYRLEIDRDQAAVDWDAIADGAIEAPGLHAPLEQSPPSAPAPQAPTEPSGGTGDDDDIPF